MKGAKSGTCRLCLADGELQYSHVYPRFAVKYLKESSASGFLKNMASGKRMQEARRLYLLCESCEQLLSKDEKTFCEHIFVPLHKENKNSFDYDKWLIRFLVGVHWKVLVTREDTYPNHAEELYPKAESEWREFLLGRQASPGIGEFHLYFTDVAVNASSPVSPKLNWYMTRAIDGTPTYSDLGQVGSYVILLRLLSYAFITPRPEEEKWIGTQVYDSGTIAGPQRLQTRDFWPLIESRIQALEAAPSTMTARQVEKFKQQAMRDPEKFLNSESTRVFLANRELKRKMAAKLDVGPHLIKGRDRNHPCPCGSGKKFKKCCLDHRRPGR
jgi:SEC-C motif